MEDDDEFYAQMFGSSAESKPAAKKETATSEAVTLTAQDSNAAAASTTAASFSSASSVMERQSRSRERARSRSRSRSPRSPRKDTSREPSSEAGSKPHSRSRSPRTRSRSRSRSRSRGRHMDVDGEHSVTMPPEEDEEADEEEEDEEEDEEDDVRIVLGPMTTASTPSSTKAGPIRLNPTTPTTPGASASTPGAGTSASGASVATVGGGEEKKGPKTTKQATPFDFLLAGQGVLDQSVYQIDLDTLEEKPWRKPGADITDYFNYGFTEDTWRAYCKHQDGARKAHTFQRSIQVYESSQADSSSAPRRAPQTTSQPNFGTPSTNEIVLGPATSTVTSLPMPVPVGFGPIPAFSNQIPSASSSPTHQFSPEQRGRKSRNQQSPNRDGRKGRGNRNRRPGGGYDEYEQDRPGYDRQHTHRYREQDDAVVDLTAQSQDPRRQRRNDDRFQSY